MFIPVFVSFRNPELYNKMKTLVEKALSMIQADVLQAWSIRTDILNTNKAFIYTLLSQSKPRFEYLIFRYKSTIDKLIEFEEFNKTISSDQVVSNYFHKYVGTSRGLEWIWRSKYVYYILEELIQSLFYTQKYDPKMFDSLYQDFEKMCYDGYIPLRDIAPLHNFDVSDRKRVITGTDIVEHTQEIIDKGWDLAFAVKSIQLEENLRLKQITQDDFKHLFEVQEKETLSLFEVGEPVFAIEYSINEPTLSQREPISIEDVKYQSEDTIEAVMTALRLFRSNFVAYSNIFPVKDAKVFVEVKMKRKYIVSEKQFGNTYSLSQNELFEFQTYWSEHGVVLKNCFSDDSKWNELSNALTHFNSSYNRTTERHKIIDLFISVEALLKTKGKFEGSITEVTSDRMTKLISTNEKEQREISKNMTRLSEERGKAVHGSRRSKYNYKLIEEYLRRAFNEYLKRIKNDASTSHEAIVNP